MQLEYIPAGVIVNAHGVRGEVKLLPQGVDPEVIARCRTLYLDGSPLPFSSPRVHKGCLLLKPQGVDSADAALALKGKPASIRRSDAKLPEGAFFDRELVGLAVRDAATGKALGAVEEVLDYPAHKIYAVRGGPDEYLIPAVPAFIAKVDLEGGFIDVHMWEGLGSHEN